MRDAWQTPHGARPNREGVEDGASRFQRVSARNAKLPGRSLEPISNDRPRGMTVSGGNAVQNSAYRFGVTCGPRIRKDLGAFNFIHAWQAFAFPITPDVGDSRAALPHTPTRIPKGLYGTIPVHPR